MKFIPKGLKNPVTITKNRVFSDNSGYASTINTNNTARNDNISSSSSISDPSSSSAQIPSTPSSVPATPTSSRYTSNPNMFQELPPELYKNLKPSLTILKSLSEKIYYSWDNKELDNNDNANANNNNNNDNNNDNDTNNIDLDINDILHNNSDENKSKNKSNNNLNETNEDFFDVSSEIQDLNINFDNFNSSNDGFFNNNENNITNNNKIRRSNSLLNININNSDLNTAQDALNIDENASMNENSNSIHIEKSGNRSANEQVKNDTNNSIIEPQNLSWSITYTNGKTESLSHVSLIGTTLIAKTMDSTQQFSLSLIDTSSSFSNYQIFSDRLSFQEPMISVSATLNKELNSLANCCSLALFEHISTYKALTATVISTMGLHLPDINIILSSQFNFKDWCEVYIENQGWVKAWCHINKKSKVKDNYTPKGKYQIKIYKDIKSNSPASPSNLICYIQDSDYIQDVFFHNHVTNYDCVNFIQNLNTIKIVGDVRFNIDSTVQKKNFFSHKRNVSTGSIKSTTSLNFETNHRGLLIRPISHRGLPHLDSLIKFIIPIFDITRKYGRPAHFNNKRTDKESLMFGYPKLPNTNYFSKKDQEKLISGQDTLDMFEDIDDPQSYAMTWISDYLNKIDSSNDSPLEKKTKKKTKIPNKLNKSNKSSRNPTPSTTTTSIIATPSR